MNEWFEAENHVERAHEFYELGRWDDAETELRQALAQNPYQAEWHFNLGLTLEAAGKYVEAVRAFGEAHALSPEDEQSALLAGVNSLRADEPRKAIEWLEKAERLSPDSAGPFVHRIEAHAMLGEHEQAEMMFYLGQQVDAECADLYSSMGHALMERGQHDKAVWCLREAARLDPETPRVQARLAEAYAATGRTERARQLYLRELRENPGDVDTLLDLGDLLSDMNREAEAEEKYRRVLEIEPDHVEAHLALGELAERMGDSGRAFQQYEIVLRLDASCSEARRRVAGMILDRAGDDLTAAHRLLRMDLRDLRERGERASDDDLEHLGELLLDSGLSGDAVEVFGMLLDRDGQRAKWHHLMGVALLQCDEVARGMEASRRALELDPRLVPAMHNLTLAFLRQGRWTRARYWLRRGLSVDGEDQALRHLRMRVRLCALREVVGWIVPARLRGVGAA